MELTILITCLVLSALFSGTETAFVSANRLKFEAQKRAGVKGVALAYNYFKKPERYLSTTLVGNNLVNVIFSSVMTLYLLGLVKESVIVLISTAFLLYFGEILPKSVARQIPNRSVKYLAWFLVFFEIVLFPLVWLSQNISQMLISLFGIRKDEVKIFFAKEDLPVLLREAGTSDDLREDQQRLLERVIRIGSLVVREVMIPRTEMTAVAENEDIQSVQQKFTQSALSRIPVYRNNLDDIIGVTYVLDQIKGEPDKIKIRPVPFFPETKRALDALQELKQTRTHIAIVIDEYGGTSGLVTIDDLVEELFGQIRDEYDKEPGRLCYHLDDHNLMLHARAEITYLNDRFHLKLPFGNYVTLGGLILKRFGHIPSRGERVEFPHCLITVLTATTTKIEWVRITMKSEHKLINA